MSQLEMVEMEKGKSDQQELDACEICSELSVPFQLSCSDCIGQLTEDDVFKLLRPVTAPITLGPFGFVNLIKNFMKQRPERSNEKDPILGLNFLQLTIRAAGLALPESVALDLVKFLIGCKVRPSDRSAHNGMNSLQLAAFYDCPSIVGIIAQCDRSLVNSLCPGGQFHFGNGLHIAVSTLSAGSVRKLIELGCEVELRDGKSRLAVDCIGAALQLDPNGSAETSVEIRRLKAEIVQLFDKEISKLRPNVSTSRQHWNNVPGRSTMRAFGLKLGERVVVQGNDFNKVGVLRFFGPTEFSPGLWAGVELDEPRGRNNGSVNEVSYFSCPENCGLFAPASKVRPAGKEIG